MQCTLHFNVLQNYEANDGMICYDSSTIKFLFSIISQGYKHQLIKYQIQPLLTRSQKPKFCYNNSFNVFSDNVLSSVEFYYLLATNPEVQDLILWESLKYLEFILFDLPPPLEQIVHSYLQPFSYQNGSDIINRNVATLCKYSTLKIVENLAYIHSSSVNKSSPKFESELAEWIVHNKQYAAKTVTTMTNFTLSNTSSIFIINLDAYNEDNFIEFSHGNLFDVKRKCIYTNYDTEFKTKKLMGIELQHSNDHVGFVTEHPYVPFE